MGLEDLRVVSRHRKAGEHKGFYLQRGSGSLVLGGGGEVQGGGGRQGRGEKESSVKGSFHEGFLFREPVACPPASVWQEMACSTLSLALLRTHLAWE